MAADPEDDDFDMLCGDCGEGIYAEESHNVECFERFATILCAGCFEDRCEEEEA